MIVVMKSGCPEAEIARLIEEFRSGGLTEYKISPQCVVISFLTLSLFSLLYCKYMLQRIHVELNC